MENLLLGSNLLEESKTDNSTLIELLKQCHEDPVLANTIQQLIKESSDATTPQDYSSQAFVEPATEGLFSLSSPFENMQSAQQQFLRRSQDGEVAQQESGDLGQLLACSLGQTQLYPGLEQLPPHDLMNMPLPQAARVHQNLMKYLSRSEKFNLPRLQLPLQSGQTSPPETSRSVQKQFSMPERGLSILNFNIPELDIPQTPSPFNLTTDSPFQTPDMFSAQQGVRRRTNSDPVLSQDMEILKPENLKHLLQKLPPAFSAVSVIAPFLPQMDVKSCCQLLKGLGKCNLHSRAWQIFTLVREIRTGNLGAHLRAPEVYNQMIQLCQNSIYNALQVYGALREDGLAPSAGVYSSLLSICAKCDDLERTEDLYKKAYKENCIDKDAAAVMVEMYGRMEQWSKVSIILQDLKNAQVEPDIQLYNSVINLACKKRQFQVAVDIYKHIFTDDLLPSHKTFLVIRPTILALFSKRKLMHAGTHSNASVDLIQGYLEFITQFSPQQQRGNLYQILMTSFDKQGEVGHATTLYDCLKDNNQCGKLSIEFCNIAISACAHQGYYAKAQTIFDDMQSKCELSPQAVTYANLLRAYKKGGQWCSAVLVFERMKEAGFSPHGAVYGSCLDLCWKAGVPWALAKAAQILVEGFELNLLDEPEELIQRNTLRLDLRALTCGAAVLTMRQWLVSLRDRLISAQDPSLLGVKRLVVVNGVGEGTKGQTSCTVVKNIVASSLAAFRSPFTLTQDSRLLKLEAQMPALKQWVLSENFNNFFTLFGAINQQPTPTAQYVEMENKIQKECGQLWSHLCRQQAMARPNLQRMNPEYVQVRLNLILQLQDLHQRCNMSELSLFSCILLMDILMSHQVNTSQWEMVRLPMLCAHFVSSADQVKNNSALFAGLAQCNSEQFSAFVKKYEGFVPQPIQFLVTPIHYLRLFVERLGNSFEDPNVQAQMALCNLLVLDVVSNPASIQFPASMIAPATLKVFRKQCGSSPEWPSVLAQLTSYNEEHPNLLECEKMVMQSRGRMAQIRGAIAN